ncbi:MAG: helix-turn-helix domain-containing protein [Geodermatophilaceae bacterium]
MPRRVRIWELLDNAPSTAARLANALSAVPNRLYDHLRILESDGLIEVVGTEVTGRMAERVYGVNRRNVTSAQGRSSPQERILFFSSLLETTEQRSPRWWPTRPGPSRKSSRKSKDAIPAAAPLTSASC